MRTAALFEKLNKLLESRAEADKKHITKLHEVLKKLKKKQKLLKVELLEVEDEQQRRKIKQDIEVINLQRRKGVEVYKELKRAREEARAEEEAGKGI
jgi:hypothetical protein